MPSIANQDFKIYGKLSSESGVPGFVCGELYAAIDRAVTAAEKMLVADGFVFEGDYITPCRQLSPGVYYDSADGEMKKIELNFDASYYDALWAIQQAIFAYDEELAGAALELGFKDSGEFYDVGYSGGSFMNEDGYLIKGTAEGGKLTSLYVSDEKALEGGIPIHFESLLPLVGELPLGTTEIW